MLSTPATAEKGQACHGHLVERLVQVLEQMREKMRADYLTPM